MGASTIVVVREDLSIPGAAETSNGSAANLTGLEAHFFNVLRDSKPDVILLDATSMRGDGVAAIGKIRERSAVPVKRPSFSKDPNRCVYALPPG